MTKYQLVSSISKKTGLDRDHVNMVVEMFMMEVRNQLSDGNGVHMRGFGSFLVKSYASRTGRLMKKNLKKRRAIIIPRRDRPIFKASKSFQNMIEKKNPTKKKESEEGEEML